MSEGMIKLNGYFYNLASKITATYVPRTPGKVNTGSDSFDKEQFLSNWIISDQRGGIGVDEMDESVHADRCHWTNCIIDYDGHIVLPRLATPVATLPAATAPSLTDGGMEIWTDSTHLTNWTASTGTVVQEATTKHGGTYSCEHDTNTYVYQAVSWLSAYAGRRFTFTCWVYTATATSVRLAIFDGSNITYGSYHAGNSAWAQLTVTAVLASTATALQVRIYHETGSSTVAYYDDAALSGTTPGTILGFTNFYGSLYLVQGAVLSKMNAGRTAFSAVYEFSASITAIFTGPNGSLLIYLGDATNYWYMTTAEAFTQTNINDATLGVLWDSKAWKQDADGNWWYSTDADSSATPTWTSRTGITDIVSQIERLGVGRDADGATVIYCSTNSWLKIWDNTNNKWLNTEVSLYGNQYHGKGFVYWNAGHYLSYGLGVKQYTPGSTASLTDVGLNRDGGLPTEYNGIIVKLTDGGDHLLALVDASLVSGTGQSGLYAYNGRGWKCWWSADENLESYMGGAITLTQSIYGDNWRAQSFTPSISHSINGVGLFGYSTGSPGTITVSIRAVDGNGQPTGSDLCSGTIDGDTLTGEVRWHNITFSSSYALTASTKYTIVVRALTGSAANRFNWHYLNPGTYSGGQYEESANAGSTWTGVSAADFYFIETPTAMHDCIVSSASSAYAAYWDCGGAVYYLDIPQGLSNPKYLSGTQTYAASGIYISPWFDADNQAFQKLSKAIVAYAKGITTTETVAIKYRVNKTATDRDTGWTTLETLNTTAEAGENIELIASGAGNSFNSFQFRLDLTRGSTNTATPDILALVLGYRLITQGNWMWSFRLLIDDSHNTTPLAKLTNLESAIESRTDVAFIYRHITDPDAAVVTANTHYVQVLRPQSLELTDKEFQGTIDMAVLEPWLP